jgi:hypothetical protein
MNRLLRTLTWLGLLVVLAMVIARTPWFTPSGPRKQITYADFLSRVCQAGLSSVRVEDDRVYATATNGDALSVSIPDEERFRWELQEFVRMYQQSQPSLKLEAPNRRRSRMWEQVLISVLVPLGAIVLLWLLFWRQAIAAGQTAPTGVAFGELTRFGAAYEDARADAQELWQRLILGRQACVKLAETLPELHLRAGDLVLVRPGSIPGEGELALLDDGGVPRVRRCAYVEGQVVFSGGPEPSAEAEVVGKVELVARRA